MKLLTISGSPHIHGKESVSKIMRDVCLALIPAIGVAFWSFGWDSVRVFVISVISCMAFEWLIQKFLLKRPSTLSDFSAMVTGILLAMNLPSTLPWYMIIIGALVAIGIAKMAFGGLGNNIFNPALVGRVFLLISFPVAMTTWVLPNTSPEFADAISGPTPLGILKEKGVSAIELNYLDFFFGKEIGGSMGEISALALLLGGIYLLFRKVITWHIPVSFIVSAAVFSAILWIADPTKYADPLFHILTGGMMLGAIFMATDMVTTPMTKPGMLIFGCGCGLLTILIRTFGAYPEGVSFAILIMNAFVPLINKGFRPQRFGRKEVSHV